MSRVGDMGSGTLNLQAQVPHTSLCCVGWDVLGDRCPIQAASLAACVGENLRSSSQPSPSTQRHSEESAAADDRRIQRILAQP